MIDTLKSSVFLIQFPWKNHMVNKILANGCSTQMGFENRRVPQAARPSAH